MWEEAVSFSPHSSLRLANSRLMPFFLPFLQKSRCRRPSHRQSKEEQKLYMRSLSPSVPVLYTIESKHQLTAMTLSSFLSRGSLNSFAQKYSLFWVESKPPHSPIIQLNLTYTRRDVQVQVWSIFLYDSVNIRSRKPVLCNREKSALMCFLSISRQKC